MKKMFDLLTMIIFGYCLFNINECIDLIKAYLVISSIICFFVAPLAFLCVIFSKKIIDMKISKTKSIIKRIIWGVLYFMAIYLSKDLFFYALFALIGLVACGIATSMIFTHNNTIKEKDKEDKEDKVFGENNETV